MHPATILVVEDEEPILDLVVTYLRAEGFTVHTACDGPGALSTARAVRPDLVVLDLLLPGMDGLEVCRRLLQAQNVCILMLTAKAEEIDRIVGLAVGADDYLTKPFSPRELVLRVKAILRRSRTPHHLPEKAPLFFRGLTVDPERREVRNGSGLVELTTREFDLLYTLAQHPGRVFTREQLLEQIWGFDFDGNDRVVDVHIGFLRRKLEDDPADPTLIQTVRGIGYKFIGRPQ